MKEYVKRFAVIVALSLGSLVLPFSLSAEVEQPGVDRIFAAYDKAISPGCSVGAIENGNFVYRKAYGMASLELGGSAGAKIGHSTPRERGVAAE
jgi:CubicO group peptidase (beta-lactamase class C family)